MDTRRNISCAIMIASSDPVRARVAVTSGIKVLKTPYHAKRPNAICERFLGSVRRACLDHVLILHEKQLHRVLRVYVKYFNEARPHQGIRQQVPQGEVTYKRGLKPSREQWDLHPRLRAWRSQPRAHHGLLMRPSAWTSGAKAAYPRQTRTQPSSCPVATHLLC